MSAYSKGKTANGVRRAGGSNREASAGSDPTGTDRDGELSGKDYDKELGKLHVELVKLQQWVVHKGLKVCIVFEGRDGAGKGGTIKAITERVSPRVFRVIALPAPTEREKSQMYIQRYLPHLPAAGEVVIFDRSWYNRAGRRARDGLLPPRSRCERFLNDRSRWSRSAIVESGHHPAQVLARSQPRGADAPPAVAHRRRAQDLEAVADGPEVLQPLVRLFACARRHVRRHRHRLRALVRRAVERQASALASTSSAHFLKRDPVQGVAARKTQTAEAAEAGRLRRSGLSDQAHRATLLMASQNRSTPA